MYLKDIKHEGLLDDFFVITMISNPVRYRSRYELYRQFEEQMKDAGAKLVTIEIAFGGRHFEITERDNPWHIQLRTQDELWHKENAINIAIQYICQKWPNAKYFAWIDADVFPMRTVREWLLETYHELQHYHFVQMFESAIDLDPHDNPMSKPHQGFVSSYIKSGFQVPGLDGKWYYYGHGHPGYAWAASREALDKVGGLIDFAILGAADRHMALGLIGRMADSIPGNMSHGYSSELMQWEARALKHIKFDIGYVRGGIVHKFHGKKKDRKYGDRWQILIDNQYDPNSDLKRDAQGLWQIEDWDMRQIKLRNEIRMYFRSRNEDSVDL